MNKSTAAQQIIAADRVPLRSFLASLHAAAEFGRSAAARDLLEAYTLQ